MKRKIYLVLGILILSTFLLAACTKTESKETSTGTTSGGEWKTTTSKETETETTSPEKPGNDYVLPENYGEEQTKIFRTLEPTAKLDNAFKAYALMDTIDWKDETSIVAAVQDMYDLYKIVAESNDPYDNAYNWILQILQLPDGDESKVDITDEEALGHLKSDITIASQEFIGKAAADAYFRQRVHDYPMQMSLRDFQSKMEEKGLTITNYYFDWFGALAQYSRFETLEEEFGVPGIWYSVDSADNLVRATGSNVLVTYEMSEEEANAFYSSEDPKFHEEKTRERLSQTKDYLYYDDITGNKLLSILLTEAEQMKLYTYLLDPNPEVPMGKGTMNQDLRYRLNFDTVSLLLTVNYGYMDFQATAPGYDNSQYNKEMETLMLAFIEDYEPVETVEPLPVDMSKVTPKRITTDDYRPPSEELETNLIGIDYALEIAQNYVDTTEGLQGSYCYLQGENPDQYEIGCYLNYDGTHYYGLHTILWVSKYDGSIFVEGL